MRAPYPKAIGAALVGALLSIFLAPTTPQAVPRNQPPQRSSRGAGTEPLIINVTVTNKHGEFLTDLKQSDFNIFEDKALQPIVSFSRADEPLSIGLLIDASASMRSLQGNPKHTSAFVTEALAKFFALSNRSNDYFVIGFNEESELLLDWTTDTQAVLKELGSIEPKGQTAFFDACYLGIDKLMHGRHSTRVLILVSDGIDTVSHYSRSEVRRLLKESNVMVYSINVIGQGAAGSSLGPEGENVLDELSIVSGGMAFSLRTGARFDARQFGAIFELIAEELRSQYAIGFLPAVADGDKNWRRIKVRMVAPSSTPAMKGLLVRARDGYYVGHH